MPEVEVSVGSSGKVGNDSKKSSSSGRRISGRVFLDESETKIRFPPKKLYINNVIWWACLHVPTSSLVALVLDVDRRCGRSVCADLVRGE